MHAKTHTRQLPMIGASNELQDKGNINLPNLGEIVYLQSLVESSLFTRDTCLKVRHICSVSNIRFDTTTLPCLCRYAKLCMILLPCLAERRYIFLSLSTFRYPDEWSKAK